MAQPPDNTRFNKAARRHLEDAEMLRKQERFANSDHLAGFAAECALKAILVGHLGCTAKNGSPPVDPGPPRKSYPFHVRALWDELAKSAQGRTGSMFYAMLNQSERPFADWDTAERYSDGTHIDAERVDAHLAAARRAVQLHQQAQINGALP